MEISDRERGTAIGKRALLLPYSSPHAIRNRLINEPNRALDFGWAEVHAPLRRTPDIVCRNRSGVGKFMSFGCITVVDRKTTLGMKGATSQQTLNEVMPLLKNLKPGFITLLIGVNDWIREGISSSKFKIRIKNLIDEIQSNLPPKKLLLITIPDFSCSPQKKNWGYGKSATNGITRLNKILKTEAALRDLVIVDIYPLSQNLCSQVGMFSDDGVHPSALQYSKWVDLIFPHLIDNLKIKSKDLKKS